MPLSYSGPEFPPSGDQYSYYLLSILSIALSTLQSFGGGRKSSQERLALVEGGDDGRWDRELIRTGPPRGAVAVQSRGSNPTARVLTAGDGCFKKQSV